MATTVKLPRYVMLKGDNGNNLCLEIKDNLPYLCFNTTTRNLWGCHEVIPVPNRKNVVMVKNLYNKKFWSLFPNWIRAEVSSTPSPDRKDCLFEVVQLSPNKVALKNLGNGCFAKRLTTEGKYSALNATAANYTDDICAQMEVSEALITRRVYDVEYLTDQLEITHWLPILLGKASSRNNTSSNSDLAVTVHYEITETNTWNDSKTFKTGLSVTMSAGVPSVYEVKGKVSAEMSFTTEMGKESGKTSSFSSTYTVKDVKPGVEVEVQVKGTQAKGKVPYKYKYKYQDTRVDGLALPEEAASDGVYTGVEVVNIAWEATDSSGTKKKVEPH